MNGRPIPGFFYDVEKGKYFKIAAASDSPIASSYTKEVVSTKKHDATVQQRQQKRAKLERKQRVQHPGILQSHTLYGAGLQREMGNLEKRAKVMEKASTAYATGWTEDWSYVVGIDWPYRVRLFAWDERSGGFLMGISRSYESSMLGSQKHIDRSRLSDWSEHQTSFLANYRSEVSSISISKSRKIFVSTLGGRTNAEACFMTLSEPDADLPDQGPTFDLQVRQPLQDENSAWSSAASPFDDISATFAVGLSKKLCLWSEIPGGFKETDLLATTSDVLSVSWLSASTIIAGQRNGCMYLYDRRSGGSSLRLRHPSTVIGLRCPNDVTVVSCGTEDSLMMYDLRMPRETSRSPKRKRLPSNITKTLPVVTYPYRNRWTNPIGFDVNVEAGLVAAADDRNRVQLYSLWSGTKANELLVPGDEKNRWLPTNPVQCLQFLEMDGKDALMASTGAAIVRLNWKDQDHEH